MVEYEGCRRGISGLGGAGARGYLVRPRDDAGEVGDLRFAAVTISGDFSPVSTAPIVVSCVPFCFRRRAASLLFNFIRIDRLVGVVSSTSEEELSLGLESWECELVFDRRSTSESEEERDIASVLRLFSFLPELLV